VKLFMSINNLIAADVELKLRHGHYEEAYQEWRANYRFLTQTTGQDTDWAGKMTLIAANGQSLTSGLSLFHAYKEIAAVHGDELIEMLGPSGLARWNLPGAMRAEYTKFIPIFSSAHHDVWFHPNFIRNRFLHSAQALLTAMDAPPGLVEEKTRAAWHEFGSVKAWTNDYLRDPMNTALSRTIFRDSLNERTGGLVARMHILDGKQRTLTLALLMKRGTLKDGEIASFLAGVGPELRNPFTGAPMGRDSTKRTIRFDIPKGGYSSFEVKL